MRSSNNYNLWEEKKQSNSHGGECQTSTNHHADIRELGKQVPEAVGLTWKDDFFVSSNDDLVAVFDRDHESLVSHYMKVSIANRVIPTMTFLVLAALLASVVFWMDDDNSNADEELKRILVTVTVVVFVLGTVCTPLSLYGDYRIIQSQVLNAQHVAVVRDGVRIVRDNTISASSSSMLAALHCFDGCLFVSGQNVTIPFDQIKTLSVSNPGEANWDMPCACLCFCCLREPFYRIQLDTGRRTSYALSGLLQPQQFCNLVWAMKRAKGEQILSDMRDELRFVGNAQEFGESITHEVV